MNDYKFHKVLLNYVEAATNLAENIKRNIVKNKKGIAVIDDKTVLALNEFMKANNEVVDFKEMLINNTIEFN